MEGVKETKEVKELKRVEEVKTELEDMVHVEESKVVDEVKEVEVVLKQSNKNAAALLARNLRVIYIKVGPEQF